MKSRMRKIDLEKFDIRRSEESRAAIIWIIQVSQTDIRL